MSPKPYFRSLSSGVEGKGLRLILTVGLLRSWDRKVTFLWVQGLGV